MKKLINLTILALFLTQSSSLFSQWLLVDNFNDRLTDNWLKRLPPDGTEPTYLEDPFETGNYGVFLDQGYEGIENYEITLMRHLPAGGIAPGEKGTIYFRYIQSGFNNLFIVGTGDNGRPVERVTNEITGELGISYPGGFANYNVIVRKDFSDGALDHRDGGAYVNTVPNYVIQDNIWYHFWLVVDNSFDSEGLSTGSYKLFVQGPGDESAQLIKVGGEKDSAAFRRAPQKVETDSEGNVTAILPASIVWVEFLSNAGPPASPNAGDPFIFDDVYFSPGEDITIPDNVEVWANRFTVVDGWADTGSLMGWLHVGSAPWVYSATAQKYIYVEESWIVDFGGWSFTTTNPDTW